jgi:hypothetical protein
MFGAKLGIRLPTQLKLFDIVGYRIWSCSAWYW